MLATPLGNTAIRRWTAHRARRKLGTVILLITHDLGVVAEFAELVVVMYAGRVVETAGVRGLFRQPQHPYTAGLLRSMPRIDDRAAPFATHRTNCGTWRFDGDDLLPLSPAAMRAKRRDFQIIFRDPFSDAGRPGRRMPILRQLLVPGGVPLLWVQTLVFYREDGSIDRERLPSPSVANTLVTAPARSYGGPAFCRCVVKSRMHA